MIVINVICCNWFVLCSMLHAICPDPLMIHPYQHVACLKSCKICLQTLIWFQFATWCASIYILHPKLICGMLLGRSFVTVELSSHMPQPMIPRSWHALGGVKYIHELSFVNHLTMFWHWHSNLLFSNLFHRWCHCLWFYWGLVVWVWMISMHQFAKSPRLMIDQILHIFEEWRYSTFLCRRLPEVGHECSFKD